MLEKYNNEITNYNGLIEDIIDLALFYNIKIYVKLVPTEMVDITYRFDENHMSLIPETISYKK